MNDTIIQYNKNMLQFQINVTVWCVWSRPSRVGRELKTDTSAQHRRRRWTTARGCRYCSRSLRVCSRYLSPRSDAVVVVVVPAADAVADALHSPWPGTLPRRQVSSPAAAVMTSQPRQVPAVRRAIYKSFIHQKLVAHKNTQKNKLK